MRFTTRYLSALAVIGLAVPALASGEATAPGAIEAYDFGFRNTAGGGTSVTINAGETVTFSYPSGTATAFTTSPSRRPADLVHPDRRRQRAGAAAASRPGAPGWEGNCRFDTPGSYPFVCDLHPT